MPEKIPRQQAPNIFYDRFRDLKSEIFDDLKYLFNMELMRVKIYVCYRLNEIQSQIDNKPITEILYCRNFIVRFYSM